MDADLKRGKEIKPIKQTSILLCISATILLVCLHCRRKSRASLDDIFPFYEHIAQAFNIALYESPCEDHIGTQFSFHTLMMQSIMDDVDAQKQKIK